MHLSKSYTELPLGHWLYRLLAIFLLVPTLFLLWWYGWREPAYRKGLIERLGFVLSDPSTQGGLWVHVASVGEAQLALTLLPTLEAQWGTGSVTVTTQTPAARAFLISRTKRRLQLFFAPLDTVGATNRFLHRVKPRMLLILERELWPEWLWQCEKRSITVVVVNARMKESSSQRWPYSAKWVRQRLHYLQLVMCADEGSARRFEQLGLAVDRICTMGNLKFDQAMNYNPPPDLAFELARRVVVVAASTHKGDEDALLPGWASWHALHTTKNPVDCQPLLVLAPRHPQRFAAVAQRLQRMGLVPGSSLAIRSQYHSVKSDTQVLLLDSIGELVHLYPLCTVCLMGGTWAPVGGHNALESLAAGCPVLFGPNTQQFPDLYAAMVDIGAARCLDATDVWAQVELIVGKQACAVELHAKMQKAGFAFIAAQKGIAVRTLIKLSALPCWPLSYKNIGQTNEL
jgi:3-deoxy-D-manno-octulosonic-acid transferase